MKRARTLFLFLVLALTFVLPGRARAQSGSGASDLDRPIAECEQQVASWERQATLQMVSIVSVIVFGALISAFHRSKNHLAKVLTLALGIATSVLTGVNSRFFDADYRTLRQSAAEGKNVIGELWAIESTVKDTTAEQDRLTARGEFSKKLLEFREISERLNGTAKSTTVANQNWEPFSLPAVLAASLPSLPSWVERPPSDSVSWCFVGKGEDASLPEAKTKSQSDAYDNAFRALSSKNAQASSADFLALIKASAIVQDSTFAYDRGRRLYVYYTLLRVGKDLEKVGMSVIPAAPIVQSPTLTFKKKGWRPGDLTSNPTAGIFALDSDGAVSKLDIDQGNAHIDLLFRLKRAYAGIAVTASSEGVFVTANSQLGCTIFKYSFSTKASTSRTVGGTEELCGGIATDGTAIYLALPKQKAIRAFASWDAHSYRDWPLNESDDPIPLVLDQIGHRLIVADHAGHVFGVSLNDGVTQLLGSDLGYVTSVAVSQQHIIVGSGHKILFLSRFNNQGENPPNNLGLTGGHVVGVAVDRNEKLWFADYENQLVDGPIPLS